MPKTLIQYRHGNYSIHGNYTAKFKVDFGSIFYLVDAASNSKKGIDAVLKYIEGDFDYGNALAENGHEFVAIYTVSNSDRIFGISSTDYGFTTSNDYCSESCFDVAPIFESLSELGDDKNIRFGDYFNLDSCDHYGGSILDNLSIDGGLDLN